MSNIRVFHEGVLVRESGIWNGLAFGVPIGAYVLDHTYWYYKSKVSLIPINFCDVPAPLKMYCLVLGIKHG